MVRVLTIDDHAPFLQLARKLLLATPGFESAGEAGSGREALALIGEAQPDLVLVDVHMPDLDGIETTKRFHDAGHFPVIVLISAQDPGQLPSAVYSCGAAEVIQKQDLGPALLRELWGAHGSVPSG